METSNHTIEFLEEDEYENIYWMENHFIDIEPGKGMMPIKLGQSIYHTREDGEDLFFCKYPYIVEYFLIYTNTEEDAQFVLELSDFKDSFPYTIGNDLSTRLGFSSLEDTLEFTSNNLEEIKKSAIKSVNPTIKLS